MNSELVFKTVFPTARGSHGAFILSSGILFQVMCGWGCVWWREMERQERGAREVKGMLKPADGQRGSMQPRQKNTASLPVESQVDVNLLQAFQNLYL